jgi:hypothetical protein
VTPRLLGGFDQAQAGGIGLEEVLERGGHRLSCLLLLLQL